MTRANGWAGGSARRAGFNDQLQHLWRTRPVRYPQQNPIAGVAAGFGRRYGVDPVLIRVAFVVATIFGGSGGLLYLAAWLLCPAVGDQVSPTESLLGRGYSAQAPRKTILLLVLLVIALITAGPVGVGLGGSGLISFALMLAGWWLLFLRQPNAPAGIPGAPASTGDIGATGYPGTAFPGGSPWAAGAYSPYTTLPDRYEPDPNRPAQNDAAPDRPRPDESQPKTVTEQTFPAETAGRTDTPARADEPEGPVAAAAESTATEPLADARYVESSSAATVSDPAAPPEAPRRENRSGFTATTTGFDPLGVAPTAWELFDQTGSSTPAPQAPPPCRPRSRLTPVVLGLAVLAAAGSAAAAYSGATWLTPGRIGAAALAVIGLGLLAGAFLRRGHGLMVVLAPLAGFVILALMIGPVKFDRSAMGDHVWKPGTVAELHSDYRITMGNGTLDLSGLALTENRTVHVRVQLGDLRVLVPPTMRLDTRCTARMGDVSCPPGPSGPATGPVLTLDIDVHTGKAEVKHA